VLKAPGGHHQTGGLYDINIRLSLPEGREVNIGHTKQNDERFSDVTFAINDAFKRARRQLQDKVRRMRGKVKTHEAEPIATVVKLDSENGFGFLQTADEREIYFHRNSLLKGDFESLSIGTRVTFFEEMGEKGPQASTVKILGKHGLR
jgi:cold shock CspA family protein